MCFGLFGSARRAVRFGFALATAVALPLATAHIVAQSTAPGGLVELATSTAVRPVMTPAEIQRLLPARGTFTFPAPYLTQGIRLTNASDCSGADCVEPVGASSWRNINNHIGRNAMYVLLTLDRKRGGEGPTLFKYNKTTGHVTKAGPLVDAADALDGSLGVLLERRMIRVTDQGDRPLIVAKGEVVEDAVVRQLHQRLANLLDGIVVGVCLRERRGGGHDEEHDAHESSLEPTQHSHLSQPFLFVRS